MRHAVFRVDGGHLLGSGHLMRCLSLAAYFEERGVATSFVGALLPEALRSRFASLEFTAIPASVARDWDLQTQLRDAELFLGEVRPGALVVVDHYQLGGPWEEAVTAAGHKVVAIDDLANRSHAADVLVDQNWFGPATLSRYDDLVPPSTARLLGPLFCVLDPAYSALRPSVSHHKEIRRIVVSFGGTDPTAETAKVLEALEAHITSSVVFDIVVGEGFGPALIEACDQFDHRFVRFHKAPPSLAPLFASADFSIGAGGTTSWERLCLGLPSLVTTVADNQVKASKSLAELGAIELLGHHTETDSDTYLTAIERVLTEGTTPPISPVDGLGGRRIVSTLWSDDEFAFVVRPGAPADHASLLGITLSQWGRAESPAVRSRAKELRSMLSGPEAERPLVAERDGVPVGFTVGQGSDKTVELQAGLSHADQVAIRELVEG